MRKFLLWMVLMGTVAGCSTLMGSHELQPGMTRAEVLEIFGPPVTLTTRDGDPAEYLNYPAEAILSSSGKSGATYSIAIVDGRVDAHGESFRLGITDVGF